MKIRMLYISPGPVMSIKENYYRLLSEQFFGDVFSSSGRTEMLDTKKVGNFSFHFIKFNFSHKLFFNIKYLLYLVLFAVKARMGKQKYDVVSTYDPLKTGLMGVIVSKIIGAKFVPEVNGVYTSDAEYIDEPGMASRVKKVVYPMVMKFVLRNADGVKLLFPSQVDQFRDLLRGKVIRAFFAFTELDRFFNVSVEKQKDILFVGFPFKRKGVDILIEAFKQISEKYPGWKLKIMGWFPDLSELEKAMNNHPHVFYHPPVEYAEMPSHIASCSIFALPSRSEAMGRVLLEAMAAGKPRVGANVDGIPMVIRDGFDGFLFEKENVDDLARKLEVLMGDEKLREHMGQNCVDRARREFSHEVYFKELRNLFDDVLCRR